MRYAWKRVGVPVIHPALVDFDIFGLFGPDMSIDPSKGFGGGVAFDAGEVFVSTGFGSIFALNAASGKQLWQAGATELA